MKETALQSCLMGYRYKTQMPIGTEKGIKMSDTRFVLHDKWNLTFRFTVGGKRVSETGRLIESTCSKYPLVTGNYHVHEYKTGGLPSPSILM